MSMPMVGRHPGMSDLSCVLNGLTTSATEVFFSTYWRFTSQIIIIIIIIIINKFSAPAIISCSMPKHAKQIY